DWSSDVCSSDLFQHARANQLRISGVRCQNYHIYFVQSAQFRFQVKPNDSSLGKFIAVLVELLSSPRDVLGSISGRRGLHRSESRKGGQVLLTLVLHFAQKAPQTTATHQVESSDRVAARPSDEKQIATSLADELSQHASDVSACSNDRDF